MLFRGSASRSRAYRVLLVSRGEVRLHRSISALCEADAFTIAKRMMQKGAHERLADISAYVLDRDHVFCGSVTSPNGLQVDAD